MKPELRFLTLACLALAPRVAPQDSREDRPEVRPEDPAEVLVAADRAFLADTEARGLEGWLAWFAADATILAPEGDAVRGAAALRDHYREQPGFPPAGFRWEPESAGMAASGDLGWTAGTYSLGGVETAGRYLTIWGKQPDGDWKVLTDLGGDVAFRTRIPRLAGPPQTSTTRTIASHAPASGELSTSLGTWTAEREGRTVRGRFLSVWRRSEDGSWTIVTEIGSADG